MLAVLWQCWPDEPPVVTETPPVVTTIVTTSIPPDTPTATKIAPTDEPTETAVSPTATNIVVTPDNKTPQPPYPTEPDPTAEINARCLHYYTSYWCNR